MYAFIPPRVTRNKPFSSVTKCGNNYLGTKRLLLQNSLQNIFGNLKPPKSGPRLSDEFSYIHWISRSFLNKIKCWNISCWNKPQKLAITLNVFGKQVLYFVKDCTMKKHMSVEITKWYSQICQSEECWCNRLFTIVYAYFSPEIKVSESLRFSQV